MGTADHHKLLKKKKKGINPEGAFQYALGKCSKKNDLSGAISLYENALAQNLKLNISHINSLLYLCSNADSDHLPNSLEVSSNQWPIEKGFEIYNHIFGCNLSPNEATITAVARLAAGKEDGDFAFQLVKDMEKYKILPRLRTYGPALFTFCRNKEAEKAYSVEEHMTKKGVVLEEPEISALLKVSVEAKKENRVYIYLQKLRTSVRCISGPTAEIIESWFRSEIALEIGNLNWNVAMVRESVLRNGGGCHGLGWLGKGKWEVCRSQINPDGRCLSCSGDLVPVDINRAETENFAMSIATLAIQREAKANFSQFQEWLENHTNYGAIIDGANVGYYRQNFEGGGFSISQMDAVVKELCMSQNKWPLVVLHNQRVQALMQDPYGRKLLEEWRAHGALYTTPKGSNDDWYWIYAAVKDKCLVVTNDEMRDHIFELLGQNFFLKWKERHQVHYTFARGSVQLLMPPPYSTVIQESETGTWHLPLDGEIRDEASRAWLCISRGQTPQSSGSAFPPHSATNQADPMAASDSALPNSSSITGKRKR